MQQQLVDAGFSRSVADKYAQVVQQGVSVLASRVGMPVMDLLKRYSPSIVRELQADAGRVSQDIHLGNGEGVLYQSIPNASPIDNGPIFTEYKHDATGAINALSQQKSGEAVGALWNKGVGDIDLIWGREVGQNGSPGYGLAKIIAKHPEAIENLGRIIESLEVVKEKSSANTIRLEDGKYRAIIKTNWKGHEKRWLLTAFMKSDASSKFDGLSGATSGQPMRSRLTDGADSSKMIDQPSGEVNDYFQSASNLPDAIDIDGVQRPTVNNLGLKMEGGQLPEGSQPHGSAGISSPRVSGERPTADSKGIIGQPGGEVNLFREPRRGLKIKQIEGRTIPIVIWRSSEC